MFSQVCGYKQTLKLILPLWNVIIPHCNFIPGPKSIPPKLDKPTGCIKNNLLQQKLAVTNISVVGDKSINTLLTNPYETKNSIVETSLIFVKCCCTLKLVILCESDQKWKSAWSCDSIYSFESDLVVFLTTLGPFPDWRCPPVGWFLFWWKLEFWLLHGFKLCHFVQLFQNNFSFYDTV